MTEQTTASSQLKTWGRSLGEQMRGASVAFVTGWLSLLALVLWRKPGPVVAFAALILSLVALAFAAAYEVLWKRERQEVRRLRLRDLQMQRRCLLLEEALYYSLAAAGGDVDSEREALDRLPRGGLPHALRAFREPRLMAARGGPFGKQGVEPFVRPITKRRMLLEEQLGPNRLEPKVRVTIEMGTSTRIVSDERDDT
jgi:hypothetical protein